jgi:DNA-binding CsgD family transcriptional regulator
MARRQRWKLSHEEGIGGRGGLEYAGQVVSAWTRDRTRAAIEKLGGARLDWPAFGEQVAGPLRRSVGFDGYCLAQTDPDTLLAVRAVTENSPNKASQQRFWRIEHQLPDVNKLEWLARSGRPVGALSAATGGDLARSRRWDEIMRPAGVIDELRAALTIGGYCWGSLTLYRESGRSFTDDDVQHLGQVLGVLAAGARGSWAARNPGSGARRADGPGTIIVTTVGTPLTTTAEARRWLGRISPDPRASQAIIYALTALITAPDTGQKASPAARVRTRTADGHWLDIHASPLAPAMSGCDIAITIQAASAARVSSLLMRAYTLSARERQIAWLLLNGRTPAEIAEVLHISLYTVKDHMKAIFHKTGTHSRPELTRCLTGRS